MSNSSQNEEHKSIATPWPLPSVPNSLNPPSFPPQSFHIHDNAFFFRSTLFRVFKMIQDLKN